MSIERLGHEIKKEKMAKSAKEKNGKNKSKHTKLLNQKINKKKQEKIATQEKLRTILNQSKQKEE